MFKQVFTLYCLKHGLVFASFTIIGHWVPEGGLPRDY